MRTRTQLYSVAYELNQCKVIEGVSGRKYNVEVVAPIGYHFTEGPHSLIESVWDTPGIRNVVRKLMLERLQSSTLETCDISCDCLDKEE